MTTSNTCCPETSAPVGTAMTVAALKVALAQAPDRVLSVVWPDGEPIEPYFHVTEIGRVQRDFVDCGGTVRRQVTCLLQTWLGEDTGHRLTGGRLLKAFAHADRILGGDDLPVELEYEACNVVQLLVVSAVVQADHIVLQLGSKHTDCLAREVCCVTPASDKKCC